MRRIKKKIRGHSIYPSEEDIYSAEFRERLLEDGEISAAEAGFMQGYEGA